MRSSGPGPITWSDGTEILRSSQLSRDKICGDRLLQEDDAGLGSDAGVAVHFAARLEDVGTRRQFRGGPDAGGAEVWRDERYPSRRHPDSGATEVGSTLPRRTARAVWNG